MSNAKIPTPDPRGRWSPAAGGLSCILIRTQSPRPFTRTAYFCAQNKGKLQVHRFAHV